MADNPRRKAYRTQINARIQDELDKKGWKINKVVEEINERLSGEDEFTPRTIYDCCNGASLPAVDCLAAIAKALGVSVDYLLGATDFSICLDPQDPNFRNSIIAFIHMYNAMYSKENKFELFYSYMNEKPMQYYDSNVSLFQLSCVGRNNFNIYLQQARNMPINTESRYIVANGNIYPEDIYRKSEFNHRQEVSVYEHINNIVKNGTFKDLRDIDKLKKVYRKERFSLGVLGGLSADAFYWLNYMMGYFAKAQG